MPAWIEPNEYFLKRTKDIGYFYSFQAVYPGILSFLFSFLLVSHLILTGYQACQYQTGTQVTYATCYKRAIRTLLYSHTVLTGSFLKQSFIYYSVLKSNIIFNDFNTDFTIQIFKYILHEIKPKNLGNSN